MKVISRTSTVLSLSGGVVSPLAGRRSPTDDGLVFGFDGLVGKSSVLKSPILCVCFERYCPYGGKQNPFEKCVARLWKCIHFRPCSALRRRGKTAPDGRSFEERIINNLMNNIMPNNKIKKKLKKKIVSAQMLEMEYLAIKKRANYEKSSI